MTITVQVARPLLYRGERVEAGNRLDVDPLTAADLVATGRAVLLRDSDGKAVNEAVQAHVRKIAPPVRPMGEPWR